MTNAQIVRDGVTHSLVVYPHLRSIWWAYVDWVRLNYSPHMDTLTPGELVEMHLADLGLTRTASRSNICLYGSQEDLLAWMLSYA